MTTETSNARGEVVAWIRVRPDGSPDWAEDCIADDDRFLNPAMEADGYRLRPLIYADAAPPPAAARGDVRGLVSLAKRVQYADDNAQVANDDAGEFVCLPPWLWLEIRDAAAEALAAEGVQAGEVADAEVWLFKGTDGAWHTFLNERHRLDTIADGGWDVRKFTALSQQPEARGVVEEEANEQRAIHAYEKHMGVSADDPAYGPDLSQWMAGWNAALTGERNG